VLFDVIWPAEYATNNVLVDVSSRITDDMKKGVLPGAWTTVDYDGKSYGMPWILDTKYLFYNKEILEKAGIKAPPKTWAELNEQAKVIKDKGLLATPDRLELVAGRGRDLRLHDACQRLWRRVPEGRQAGLHRGWRSRSPEVHGRQLQVRPHQSELQGVPRRGRAQRLPER
jgi:hypothetical protein